MRLSSSGLNHQTQEGEKKCLNSELWHACAGPLVLLPPVGSRAVYFPQGHSEQVSASTNKEVDVHSPNYPNLPPQLICLLHNVTMHADVETDEVYAQMTLQPLSQQEQKDLYLLPAELGAPNKQPTNYFCKTLTASDTSTHGGFSVPRRAAEKVFPPLDFSQQPPAQELFARDLHDNEWKFRHIFRGQPKRHLLTTGWSVFVSAKRLVAGDSVLFIWNENNQLLIGIRRANRLQTIMPSSVLSSDSMHIGLLAAAAHAATTNSRFTIFYNPRASPSEFVISLAKYVKAVYHTRVSVGMRFRMLFETEGSSIRRYMGTIMGISDLDPARWPNSHWRSVKVGWDESTAEERQPRVSLWEIEPLTTFPMYPSPFPLRLKRSWSSSLPSVNGLKEGDMSMNLPSMWLGSGISDQGIQSFNLGFSMNPWMQQAQFDASNVQPDVCQAMATAALQKMRAMDPTKCTSPSSILQQAPSPSMANMSFQRHMLQQPEQPQNMFLQGFQESQQDQLLHQQLQRQQSLNDQRQQQQTQQIQQVTAPQQTPTPTIVSSLPQYVSSSQTQPDTMQTFPECVGTSDVPLMQSILGSMSHDVASPHLLNRSGSTSVAYLQKQNSVESLSEPVHSDLPQVEQLVPPHTFVSDVANLPPFPGKEYSAYEGAANDPQSSLLFGVNIDSSPFMLQNGIQHMQGISNENESMSVPFSSDFRTAAASDFPEMTTSSCMDNSGFLQSSDHVDQGNSSTGTFVKVQKLGSLGRSLDVSKFSNYPELRSELAEMFGLQGQLEDPQRSGWQLVFVDRENDVLLLGDDPWQEFVNNVWYIKILSPLEVQQLGKEGLNPTTTST